MSTHRCRVCHQDPGIFFFWSTTRYFPREKLGEILEKENRFEARDVRLGRKAVKVCYACAKKLKYGLKD